MADLLERLAGSLPDKGKEQSFDDGQLDDDKVVEQVRRGVSFLRKLDKGALGKFVKQRWKRMEKQARVIQNELRVNYLRYEGETFAQVHPTDPNRLYVPSRAKTRTPPSVNKILRTVHRYVAQVTSDDPILEGVPAGHNDDDRDAAEGATDALRSEWQRMGLTRKLRRAAEVGAVMRSGFWFFEYDEFGGGRVPAQKYFKDPQSGRNELRYVDSSGNKVEDVSDAAKMRQGNNTVDVLFPMNVRWAGGNRVEEADEVLVGKVLTLRQLYEMDPKTKDAKLGDVLGFVTKDFEKWMHEIRGAGGIADRNESLDDDDLELDGHAVVTEKQSLLDEKVMLLHYFRPECREYPDGFHSVVAGKYTVWSGKLRYGVVPVAQIKCLDSLKDPLGKAIVDELKDPQELLDFVNGQILRFLQSMKRRWFVPLTSNVNERDLTNPTNSIIYYNAHSESPTPEQPMEIPRTMTDWAERFDVQYDDVSGIHDTMQGKHTPGVSSGRHAEALRSGDETILGLTRGEILVGLEQAGKILLAMIQKEWSSERKIRFFDGQQYVEKAFSNTDFGETSDVRLKRGTLLMMTPAQRLETLYSYLEMQLLTPEEFRELAPLHDVAGANTTEDPHYQKARRENALFLEGPPPKLEKARKAYEREMKELIEEQEMIQKAVQIDEEQAEDAQIVAQRLSQESKAIEGEWEAVMSQLAPVIDEFEAMPTIASVHVRTHSDALASEKAKRLPKWWVAHFEQHTMSHWKQMQPPSEGEGGQQQPAQQA